MKKKLLIINRSQFGYHIDTFYYCKYLSNKYDITYLCWDYNKPRQEIDGVTVKYVSRDGSKIKRYLRYIKESISEARSGYDICFVVYFVGCILVKMFSRSGKHICDIRTGYVRNNNINRIIYNFLMKQESMLFEKVTVISKSLAELLHLSNSKKISILPLGSDVISEEDKKFNEIKLLYVGTLEYRNLEQTLHGFYKFYEEYKNKTNIDYIIIGTGSHGEEDKLREITRSYGLENVVKILGLLPHSELKPYFDKQNLGISYIPKTSYFDCQPATKTFEYILSGMPVIATSTKENCIAINDINGVLISDNSDEFYKGLCQFYSRSHEFNSNDIRNSCIQFTWENIVKNTLIKLL